MVLKMGLTNNLRWLTKHKFSFVSAKLSPAVELFLNLAVTLFSATYLSKLVNELNWSQSKR